MALLKNTYSELQVISTSTSLGGIYAHGHPWLPGMLGNTAFILETLYQLKVYRVLFPCKRGWGWILGTANSFCFIF